MRFETFEGNETMPLVGDQIHGESGQPSEPTQSVRIRQDQMLGAQCVYEAFLRGTPINGEMGQPPLRRGEGGDPAKLMDDPNINSNGDAVLAHA